MVVVKATVVDSTHLELASPISTGRGETVVVSVAESGELAAERSEWAGASAGGLEAAYAADEPEYSLGQVKESNPEYEA